MKTDVKKALPRSYCDYLNSLIKSYVERYQDIPLESLFKMNIDYFLEDILSIITPDFRYREFNVRLKTHLIAFQRERQKLNQGHVPYPLKYIYVKEFYWSISGFLLGEVTPVTKRLLFVELLYMRHQIFALSRNSTDITLNGGSTYFALAVHGHYEKYGNNFGMNDHFFRPEDIAKEVDHVLTPLYADGFWGDKIKEIDNIIETHFDLYEILAKER